MKTKRMNPVARRSVGFILLQTKHCLSTCAMDVRRGQTKAALASAKALLGNARQAEEIIRLISQQKTVPYVDGCPTCRSERRALQQAGKRVGG
jgi:hypothetical protein